MTTTESEIAKAVEENTRAVRVTNALLLAQSLGLDASDPVQGNKVLRYLTLVEGVVGRSDSNG